MCEYLKGVDVDVIKPDVHICRILGIFSYSKTETATTNEAISIIYDMSREYNMPKMEIDTILWKYVTVIQNVTYVKLNEGTIKNKIEINEVKYKRKVNYSNQYSYTMPFNYL